MPKAYRVYLAHRVIQVSPDDVESRVHQECQECPVAKESWVMQVHQVPMDFLAYRARRESQSKCSL